MGKGSNKFNLQDYKIDHTNSLKREATILANFEIPDYVKSIGDEVYINMNLERLMAPVYIDGDKRKMAVENDFLYTIHQVHVLTIPNGYAVEYLPNNKTVSNDIVKLSIEYAKIGETVVTTQKFVIKSLYILPTQFSDWNTAVSTISPEYKEQVVLKKK